MYIQLWYDPDEPVPRDEVPLEFLPFESEEGEFTISIPFKERTWENGMYYLECYLYAAKKKYPRFYAHDGTKRIYVYVQYKDYVKTRMNCIKFSVSLLKLLSEFGFTVRFFVSSDK